MSRFFSKKYSELEAYTPGEQPRDMKYIKLNTNESPFPPSPDVLSAVASEVEKLRLYSDPECKALTEVFAELMGVPSDSVLMTNGSDEILNFLFMAFCDAEHPIIFPDITYGFYPVFAKLNGIPYEEIPLKDDFSVDYRDYLNKGKNIVIANPNAPTGLLLSLSEIEKILKTNPDNIVIIDEAYIDFGGESAVSLIEKYDNLAVTGTFSKSRSMAGARLGFGIASPEIIKDLNTIKYSTNPYNINRMTMAAGIAAVMSDSYYKENCKKIIENREYAKRELSRLGFEFTDSKANFLFAKAPGVSGETVYTELRKRGILVRRFGREKIKDYNRITVGTREDMEALVSALSEITEKSK